MNSICSLPYCDGLVTNASPFDQNSVRCMHCGNAFCPACTQAIWSGAFNAAFEKPRLIVAGLVHQTFTCPLCRSTFDRVVATR